MERTKRNRAFTLVELLVVIAIIAVLLAVLMPGLAKARAVGKTMTCGSRLRALAFGTQLYVDEYNGKFFSSYGPLPSGQQAWATEPQGQALQVSSGAPKLGFYPGSIFDCPAQLDRGIDQGRYWASAVAATPFVGFLDFAYNACLGDGDSLSTKSPAPMTRRDQSSGTVMFWDSTRYRGYYNPKKLNGTSNPDYWNDKNTAEFGATFHPLPAFMQWPHSNMANFAFVDGHVERAKEETVTDEWFKPVFGK